MHFITITALLISATSALTIRDKYIANYRVWSAPGCPQSNNLGVGTITSDNFHDGVCKRAFQGDTVESISLTNIIAGCTMTVYTDEHCTQGATLLTGAACTNAQAQGQLKAWIIKC